LLIRRLFRGLYDGFIRGILPSEPGKLVGSEDLGQVKEAEEAERAEEAEIVESRRNDSPDRRAISGSFSSFRLFRFFRPVKPRLTFPHPARNISRP
jgi:hypothetical protein